ncbi:hypothetical protein B0H11DRAFT_1931234 [Mycena galericulata]|nr:hypothetical protein B0H11DRAFT_1931234 [Mycena galericulata]
MKGMGLTETKRCNPTRSEIPRRQAIGTHKLGRRSNSKEYIDKRALKRLDERNKYERAGTHQVGKSDPTAQHGVIGQLRRTIVPAPLAKGRADPVVGPPQNPGPPAHPRGARECAPSRCPRATQPTIETHPGHATWWSGASSGRLSNSADGTELPITPRKPYRFSESRAASHRCDMHSHLFALAPAHHVPPPPLSMRKSATLAHKVPVIVVKNTIRPMLRYMSRSMREHNPDDVSYSVQDFIDDRAFETDNEEDDAPEDDEDSSEAQLRRLDEQDFDMPAILDGHDERLRADAEEPYRIPEHLVQLSGAETPARGEDDYPSDDIQIHSRPTSPAPSWTAQPMSRGITPAYVPASPPAEQTTMFPDPFTVSSQPRQRTPLFLPGSRSATPFAYHGPPFSRDSTPYWPFASSQPLFLPDSRRPTPFTDNAPPLSRDLTTCSPSSSSQPIAFRSPSPAPDSPPSKRRRVHSPPRSSSPAISTTSSAKRAVLDFLDTAAGDSDEDAPEENEDDDEETLSDAGE